MAEVPLPSESDGSLPQNGRVPSSTPSSSPDGIPKAHLDESLPPQVVTHYEAAFMKAIARQLPIGERDRQHLHQLQQILGLSDVQARQINQRILNQVEQTETHYHQTKIQEYGQQFVAFIEQEWPISAESRAILTQLQTQLQLRNADVQALEHHIVAQRLNKAASLLANAPINPIPSTPDPNPSFSTPATPTPATPDVAGVGPEPDPSVDSQNTNVGATDIQAAETQDQTIQFTSIENTSIQDIGIQDTGIPGTDLWGTFVAEMVSNPEAADSAHSLTSSSDASLPFSAEQESAHVASSATALVTELGTIPPDLQSTDLGPDPSPIAIGTATSLPATELEVPSSELGAIAASPQEPVLKSEREIDYVQLKTYLHGQEWQKADEETLNMMLKITARRVAWLDRQAISELPCTDLKTIDNLWHYYSKGHFGFRIQQAIFKTTQASSRNVARFGKKVGWTLLDNEYVGFKYYQQLSFELTAPPGHLPAKWFWTIPWWESIRSGGLGTGRGGCGDDAAGMLFAMMYQFVECSSQT